MKFLIAIFFVASVSCQQSIRVEYNLLDYNNDGGLLATGKKCETSRHCDPRISGYVDTEQALNAWPGPKTDFKTWAQILDGKDTDNVKLGKIVSRDICRGRFTKANLRVKVVDTNRITSDKDITNFECLTGSASDVARSEGAAVWSPVRSCSGSANPDKVRMNYKWRAFTIPSSQCGETFETKTTKKSGFFG